MLLRKTKGSLFTMFVMCALFFITVICGMFSCSKMDDTYKKFLKDGDIIYPGRIDSISIFSGHNRIKISGVVSDPNVELCRIYWNNRMDSLNIDIDGSRKTDYINLIIDSLEEGYYNFEIYTFDREGNISVPVDTIGQVYGDIYESTLHNRLVKESYFYKDSAFIFWLSPPKGAVNLDLVYKDSSGEKYKKEVSSEDTLTILPHYSLHSIIQYRTGFVPDSMSIDTFYTAFTQLQVDSVLELPSYSLTMDASVVDQSSNCSCGIAANIIDGDKATYWQPLSGDRNDGNIWVTIDLGSSKEFKQMKQYWLKGADQVSSYRILYSNDNISWHTAYEQLSGIDNETNVVFAPVKGRYVKIDYTLNGTASEQIAEIEIYD